MNPSGDDIKAVLLFLKENRAATFTYILKKLPLGYNELGARKFKKFLIEKNLIEPTEQDGFQYGGGEHSYWLTGEGDSLLLEILEAENLDKILVFLKENANDFTMYDIAQRCNGRVSPEYGNVLVSEGLATSFVSKDHNGQRTYKINSLGVNTVKTTNGKHYFIQVFEDLMSKSNTQSQPAQSFPPSPVIQHFNFGGDNKGQIVTGGTATQTYNENTPPAPEKKESRVDKITKYLKLPGLILGAMTAMYGLYKLLHYVQQNF